MLEFGRMSKIAEPNANDIDAIEILSIPFDVWIVSILASWSLDLDLTRRYVAIMEIVMAIVIKIKNIPNNVSSYNLAFPVFSLLPLGKVKAAAKATVAIKPETMERLSAMTWQRLTSSFSYFCNSPYFTIFSSRQSNLLAPNSASASIKHFMILY